LKNIEKTVIFKATAIITINAIKKISKKLIFMFEFKQTHNLFAKRKSHNSG
jgi:hypothetical protein